MRRIRLTALIAAFALAGPAMAAGWVEQKTEVKFQSKMMNRLAKGAADDVTKIYIHGDAKRTVTGNSGTVVDFEKDLVCQLKMKRKRATCATTGQTREKMQYVSQGFGGLLGGGDSGRAADEGAQGGGDPTADYEVSVDIRNSDDEEMVNGFKCKKSTWVFTAKRKGMSLEEGGGAIITVEMKIGPKLAVLDEIQAFDSRYAEAIGLPGGEQMAQAIRGSAGLGAAFKKLEDNQKEMPGSPIHTLMILENVAGKNGESAAGQGLGSALKGMFGGGGGGAKPGERTEAFRSITEILAAGDTRDPADARVPAGFKLKME